MLLGHFEIIIDDSYQVVKCVLIREDSMFIFFFLNSDLPSF